MIVLGPLSNPLKHIFKETEMDKDYFNRLALRNFMADRLVELCMENSLRAIGDPVDEAPARLLYALSRKI